MWEYRVPWRCLAEEKEVPDRNIDLHPMRKHPNYLNL